MSRHVFLEIDALTATVTNVVVAATPEWPLEIEGFEYIAGDEIPEVGIGFTRNPDGTFSAPATEEI